MSIRIQRDTKRSSFRTALLFGAATLAFASPAAAQDAALLERLEALEAKMNSLESENESLKAEISTLRSDVSAAPQPAASPAPARAGAVTKANSGKSFTDTVGVNPPYGFRVLDQAVDVTTKPLIQLEALQNGELDDRVTVSGQVTAIANFQWSNRDSKFGYLMRNPTSANQIGDHVSEAVLHSANIAVTGRITKGVTAYAELLYDPQQNFASGTITGLARNNVSLRRGYLLVGDLDKSPVYGAIGKMDVPFGLNDTVNPFTNSTTWHAFAPLAFGAQVGYHKDGLDVRAMAVQGGAQFRSANANVEGTSVPSRLNNFAVDARYAIPLGGEDDTLLLGGSYIHGTAYCQGYPIFHFNPCDERNPGVTAYGRLDVGGFQILADYAQTTRIWPGTQVPNPMNPLSAFPATKTKAFTVGSRYAFGDNVAAQQRRAFAVSGEFSKFIAGPEDAPWNRQNQIVAGFSWFPESNFNLFSEFIHVDGFAPLNFLTGGNFPDGSTWSERDAATNVILIGGTASF